jgi:hypothetical protein
MPPNSAARTALRTAIELHAFAAAELLRRCVRTRDWRARSHQMPRRGRQVRGEE